MFAQNYCTVFFCIDNIGMFALCPLHFDGNEIQLAVTEAAFRPQNCPLETGPTAFPVIVPTSLPVLSPQQRLLVIVGSTGKVLSGQHSSVRRSSRTSLPRRSHPSCSSRQDCTGSGWFGDFTLQASSGCSFVFLTGTLDLGSLFGI